MTERLPVKKPAPLKNVAAFSTLIQRVVRRSPELPGLACFYGPSGLGKTKSAVFGANMYRAAYVECGEFTTAKSLLEDILKELGVTQPRGTIPGLIEDAVRILASDIQRPLIIDEAHQIAKKRWIDLVRELHDKSMAPIILIGEETLPKQLEAYERVHNRMLDWVAAVPCDDTDFAALARSIVPGLTVESDLADAILQQTRGNTRRIVVNLDRAQEIASQHGETSIGLTLFGGATSLVGSSAPLPRRVA